MSRDREKRAECQRRYRAKNREKIREYERQWRARNPEKMAEYNRRRLAKDPKKRAEYQHQNYLKNREKRVEQNRRWRKENPDKVAEYNRRGRAKHREKRAETARRWREKNLELIRENALLRKYGISRKDWDALFDAQGGVCCGCGRRTKLVVDHNHVSGAVRGLLCNGCNTALGQVQEKQETLRNLAFYLDRTAA